MASIIGNYSKTNIYKALTTSVPKPFNLHNGRRRLFNDTIIIVRDQLQLQPSSKTEVTRQRPLPRPRQLELEREHDYFMNDISNLAHTIQSLQQVSQLEKMSNKSKGKLLGEKKRKFSN